MYSTQVPMKGPPFSSAFTYLRTSVHTANQSQDPTSTHLDSSVHFRSNTLCDSQYDRSNLDTPIPSIVSNNSCPHFWDLTRRLCEYHLKNICGISTQNKKKLGETVGREINNINVVKINFTNNCIDLIIDNVNIDKRYTTRTRNHEIFLEGEKKTEETTIDS